jgi:uncharacterized membrane protein YeaQ/YmgE (transglycosylase-associated protein family)
VGLVAKAILPGRDPGGVIATIGIGAIGAIMGCGAVTYFLESRVTPMSFAGFAAATAGAFILLVMHRLLSGGTFTRASRRGIHPDEEIVVVRKAGRTTRRGRHAA